MTFLALWLWPLHLWSLERYIIDTKADWQKWTYPSCGVVKVTDDGWVRVGYVRKHVNACLNAHEFTYQGHTGQATGGIRSAGSNPGSAEYVIDGDLTTFWAPDLEDDVGKWWIEVDLGRAVVAEKLRLRFAEGRIPFPEFKIYVSTGDRRFPGTKDKSIYYEPVAHTVKPNTEYVYEVTFDHERDLHGNPLSGKFIQYVKIFFTRKVESPGLAEVEVIALGDNIALGTVARGGFAKSGQVSLPINIFDGLMWTGWRMSRLGDNWLQGRVNGPWFNWDLGAVFWVDMIKLSTGIATTVKRWDEQPMDGFKIYFSDGRESVLPKPEVWQVQGRNFKWEKVIDVNNTLVLPKLNNFEFHFSPPKRVRYIFFHHFYGQGIWRTGYALSPSLLLEFQIFGEGYIPGVELTSSLIDLGATRSITSISWEGDIPPGTHIQVRSRTGEQIRKKVRFYDKSGREVTRSRYYWLPPFARGDSVVLKVPDERYWSGWSAPYTGPGAQFASPSPRRYVQLQVRLLSDDPKVAPSLDSITLFYGRPAAGAVFGEVRPRTAEPGIPQEFHLVVRPMYTPGSTGFNRILVRTPSRPEGIKVWVRGNEVALVQILSGEDSLLVRLPWRVRRDSVEIDFRCAVFSNGTEFSTFISGTPDVWQRVDPDPSVRKAMQVMLPSLAKEDALLGNVQVDPVFTPDGDGQADELFVRFTVLKVKRPRRVRVELYDLEGKLVRVLYDRKGRSGNYGYEGEIRWDGRDERGDRVAPGVYVCRIRVDGDTGKKEAYRTVCMVY